MHLVVGCFEEQLFEQGIKEKKDTRVSNMQIKCLVQHVRFPVREQ